MSTASDGAIAVLHEKCFSGKFDDILGLIGKAERHGNRYAFFHLRLLYDRAVHKRQAPCFRFCIRFTRILFPIEAPCDRLQHRRLPGTILRDDGKELGISLLRFFEIDFTRPILAIIYK